MNGAREEIFSRIKEALGSESSARPDSGTTENIVSKLSWSEPPSLVEQMLQRIEDAGGTGNYFESVEVLPIWLRSFLTDLKVETAVISSAPAIETLGIPSVLKASGCSWYPASPAEERDFQNHAEAAQVGIGTAIAGFADNGAIFVSSSSEEPRVLSLLPEAHIAVLREEDIYPSMTDFAGELGEMFMAHTHSAITLIGGPSKTADIEKTLVQGVHGPRIFVVAIAGKGMLP